MTNKPTIYFEAAEKVANGKQTFACHAIDDLCETVEPRTKWVKRFRPKGVDLDDLWTYEHGDNETEDQKESKSYKNYVRNARVLALLFADLMEKDGVL